MKCAHCQTELPPRTKYFCLPCWTRLPAAERHQVVRMDADGQDLASKIAKCVRLLQEAVQVTERRKRSFTASLEVAT